MLDKIRKLNYLLMSLLFLFLAGGLFLFYYLDQKERAWAEGQFLGQSFSHPNQIPQKEEVQGVTTDKDISENKIEDPQILLEGFSQEEAGQNDDVLKKEETNNREENLKKEAVGQKENNQESEKEVFSFVVIGDSEDYKTNFGYSENLPTALQKAASLKGVDFAIFTGDIITTAKPNVAGNRQNIERAKKLLDNYFSKYYLAFGGHDIECGKICIDYWLETLFSKEVKTEDDRRLFHSFDFGNTHFVLLSSEYPESNSVDSEQLNWLEQDLANCQKENKIVISHVPPVTFFKESAKKGHDMSSNPFSQSRLLNILKKHKVDLVISGHEHAFDHKIVEGIDFILAGSVGQRARYKNIIKGDIITHIKVDRKRIFLQSFKVSGERVRDIVIK